VLELIPDRIDELFVSGEPWRAVLEALPASLPAMSGSLSPMVFSDAAILRLCAACQFGGTHGRRNQG
jgi:hypothetical protein